MLTEPLLLPHPRRLKVGNDAASSPDAVPHCRVDPTLPRPQMYRLMIDAAGVKISGSDDAGVFYGQQTLAQLWRQYPRQLPTMQIEDWSDFPARGVMLDISRDKVPTMHTLFELVDLLAHLKINQLQLYTEHTFAYRGHEVVWKDASPMTADEIRQLDSYCRQRFIELVPNQNSFGHLERWFKHPQYQHLAEAPDGFVLPWGAKMPTGFSLNPLDPRSIRFIEDLYDQLLPNFTSSLFNAGCDETFDLGLGRSKAEVQRRGRERVYLDFLLKIYRAVKQRGRTMMFWGDIILHRPELIGELPKDVIALDWGYEHDHPFQKQTRAFHDAGTPFYVCPGTSSWCSISGRTDNAIGNLRNAAEAGLQNGAIGYLNTDWGDHGHLQYLPVSFLPFAAGAAFCWCYESNRHARLDDAIDLHVFRDRAGIMARLMRDLGNVYQAARKPISNSSRLFRVLIDPQNPRKLAEGPSSEEYEQSLQRIEEAVAKLDQAKMDRPDAELIRSEILNAAEMLRHACRRGGFLLDPASIDRAALGQELRRIIAEHRRLWLARNRSGGLNDSAARLERLLHEYA